METQRELTVGEVARLSGVTVRTLHHYHELGLVVPDGRSEAGYRRYGHGAVERLQEVLFFRELGFALEEIKRIVDQPSYHRVSALSRQRELLEAKAKRLQHKIEAIDHSIEAQEGGNIMSHKDMLEVFTDIDPEEHERNQQEAKERWGETDAYKQSARRTSQYTKADWQRIKEEMDAIYRDFVSLMDAGSPADGPEAAAVVERHRAHISQCYYDCSPEIHAGLGQMYVADPRFTENIDKAGEGLAAYMSAAIAAKYA